jgi:hypothetical protein
MTTEAIAAPAEAPELKVPVASEVPPAPANDAPPAQDTSAPDPSEVDKPDAETEQKKPKVSFSERIGQITAARKQAEAERSIALQEVERLRREIDAIRGQEIDNLPFEQQDSARVREVLKQEKLADKEAEVAARDTFVKQARQAGFMAKVEAVSDRMPDLLEKFASVPVSEQAAELIAESDRAAEIAYYLANNPREAHEIASLPAHLQGARIARIEAKVSSAPSVRKVSNAPQPIPTLKGGSSPGTKDPGEMTMEEYVAWRKAGNS